MELKRATCRVQACRHEPGSEPCPASCPMAQDAESLAKARVAYASQETRELAQAAARTEAAGYCKEPRVEEIMSFARRPGVCHLGIASCIGLIREAELLQEIFEADGFEVSSVCCKAGSIPKEEIGLADEEKVRPGGFEALCNPVAALYTSHSYYRRLRKG